MPGVAVSTAVADGSVGARIERVDHLDHRTRTGIVRHARHGAFEVIEVPVVAQALLRELLAHGTAGTGGGGLLGHGGNS